MRINADFASRAAVAPNQYQWVASPQGGVERMMLDRVGAEKARATSIVRYAPNSFFPRHQHPGGEEILVLSGTFSDETADYPAGWYMRNPPGTSHQPSSAEGAVIFVKLRQMPDSESRSVRVNTCDPANWTQQDDREVCPLFSDTTEQVRLERLAPGASVAPDEQRGVELLVLEGSVQAQSQTCDLGSWIRLPVGERPAITAGPQGATVYLKTGHLAHLMLEAA